MLANALFVCAVLHAYFALGYSTPENASSLLDQSPTRHGWVVTADRKAWGLPIRTTGNSGPLSVVAQPTLPKIPAQSATDEQAWNNLVTLGDASNLESMQPVIRSTTRVASPTAHAQRQGRRHHTTAVVSNAHRSFAKPGATVHDLARQVQQWQDFEAAHASDATHAVALSIGLHDIAFDSLRQRCTADDPPACAAAAAHAHALLADRTARPESLRNMLANVLFQTCVRGRSASPAFRVHVSGYDADALAPAPHRAPLRGVVAALNAALRDSVDAVNADWGADIAVFVERGPAARGARSAWSRWVRGGRGVVA